MTDIPIPTLSRPAFFDGQALTAADLNAVAAYHRELLWLHQRSLHGSGIVSGLVVTGAKGDKNVTVGPGYAVDTGGRSIVLDAPQVLDIPSVVAGSAGGAVSFYLTIAYSDDDQLTPAVRSGVCGSNGAVRRIDAPQLAWQDPTGTGQDIVICAITVLNCKLTGPVDLTVRRSALPDRQPYVYAGQTQPSTKAWDLSYADAAKQNLVGLKVTVDTSEAGFANTPIYQAVVVGDRSFQQQTGQKSTAVVDGYVQVSAASPGGFDLTMTVPKGDNVVNPDWVRKSGVLETVPVQNSWYVSWVGVES
jgi:hypothetical protein